MNGRLSYGDQVIIHGKVLPGSAQERIWKVKYKKISRYLYASIFALAILLPAHAAQDKQGLIHMWWPLPGSQISGMQPFQALIDNRPADSYDMFWQVDNGQWNWMGTNTSNWPHKETLVDVSGWSWKGNGPYNLNFIAVDKTGVILGNTEVPVTIPRNTQSSVNEPGSLSANAANQTIQSTSSLSSLILETKKTAQTAEGNELYVQPYSKVEAAADVIAKSRPRDAAGLYYMAKQPTAVWFGNWNKDITGEVSSLVTAANNAGKTPILVAYNIPQRDCGGWSAGGSNNYGEWINSFAKGLGDKKAIVILEPDALAGLSCLSPSDQQKRLQLLGNAVDTLAAHKNIRTYIDAGHAGWISTYDMAERLKSAHVDQATGFSLNVSNFMTNESNIAYGQTLSNTLGGKRFVIDTSRNGNGPDSPENWCNPQNRALGAAPTQNTGVDKLDAYLWIKNPAESDGYCNGGPAAGEFWMQYAVQLSQNSRW